MTFKVSKTPRPWTAAASKWGAPLRVQVLVKGFDGDDVPDVPLVVLEDEGHGARRKPELGEVRFEVHERLAVRFTRGELAVRDENDAVDALQHQPPRGVVEDLTGHGVELEADLHPPDHPDVEGQQVEEQGAVGLGLQAQHLAAGAPRGLLVDPLEVAGLAAQPRAVVHDLGRDLHRRVVHQGHGGPESSTQAEGSSAPRTAAFQKERPAPTRYRSSIFTTASSGRWTHWYSARRTTPMGSLNLRPAKTLLRVPVSLTERSDWR